MEQMISFGDWLRRRREALDLTHVERAQRVARAKVTIQKIEAEQILVRRLALFVGGCTLAAAHLRAIGCGVVHASFCTFRTRRALGVSVAGR
ncbi:MAG: hypothetical protein NVS2B7_19550 [Herpetosiphon sp.]